MTHTASSPDTLAVWEPHIQAFVISDPGATHGTGPLSDLTAGIKDIIDVKGWPTRNGSAACVDAAPATEDADIVAALRAAGTRILGKTVTTEFAFTDPTNCRNPHDLTRSPGGSSSGSGAAVGAGVLDFALGTQTAGSVCRPAAYCGAVGFKPSFGTLPMTGVTPMAVSFDTMGIIARTVPIARRVFDAVTPDADAMASEAPVLQKGLFTGDVETDLSWVEGLDAAGVTLSEEGLSVISAPLACDVTGIIAAHRVVMLSDAFAAHGHLLAPATAERLRPNFRAGLEEGRGLASSQVSEARAFLAEAREAFWTAHEGIDMVLTLPVPEGAPLLGGTTGFQGWQTPWTVFGGPLITLPWGKDDLGRPRAVMLAGRPGADQDLLALAARLEARAPELALPTIPDA